jgi:hypothetical protein
MSRARIAIISSAVAVLLSVVGCGTVAHQDDAREHQFTGQSAQAIADTNAAGDVEITSTKRANDPYSGPELQTKYTVTNPTTDKVSYTITFEYLDKNGTRTGEDYGNVESLSGHQSSRESLTLWGDDLHGVVSVRVIDVTRVPVS